MVRFHFLKYQKFSNVLNEVISSKLEPASICWGLAIPDGSVTAGGATSVIYIFLVTLLDENPIIFKVYVIVK